LLLEKGQNKVFGKSLPFWVKKYIIAI